MRGKLRSPKVLHESRLSQLIDLINHRLAGLYDGPQRHEKEKRLKDHLHSKSKRKNTRM